MEGVWNRYLNYFFFVGFFLCFSFCPFSFSFFLVIINTIFKINIIINEKNFKKKFS